MRYNAQTGIADTVGGPSGWLVIKDGKVKPLNEIGMNVPNGISEEDFLNTI